MSTSDVDAERAERRAVDEEPGEEARRRRPAIEPRSERDADERDEQEVGRAAESIVHLREDR